MKEITLPVTIHPNIHLLLPLVQPEPADTDSRPETQHCHGCGGGEYVCVQSVSYSRGIPKNGRSIPGSYDIMSV